MNTWESKAKRIIRLLCERSYREANFRNGRKLKRHVPYSVPEIAQELVRALGNNDEETAKAIFLSYEGLNLIKAGS